MIDLAAAVRFLHLTALVLLAGSFSFTALIARPAFKSAGEESLRLRYEFLDNQLQLARVSAFLAVVTALSALWLQAIAAGDLSVSPSGNLAAAGKLLTDTHYGRVWIARMTINVLLVGLLLFRPGTRANNGSGLFIILAVALTSCLLILVALSGHAAAAEGAIFGIQVASDVLHLLAAAAWLGGLIPLVILLSRCRRYNEASALSIAGEATRRFSRLGLISVVALIVTGIVNAWLLVGGVPALFGTAYGKLLSLKIALLVPMILLAAVNLRRLKPRLMALSAGNQREKTSELISRLTRNVIAEACLGIAILSIAGRLGVTPPARHVQPEWPFSTRWSWGIIQSAPKARAEVVSGAVWAGIGVLIMSAAIFRRQRRLLILVAGVGVLGYGSAMAIKPMSIDAYPTTYRRPGVPYHTISVANGWRLYRESCVVCHGFLGYGDGPAAEDLRPKPADLTARHANDHTAGDLYWWLSYGVRQTAMPGFADSYTEEERWDLVNFLRALSSAERSRSLAPVIDEPWLVAPDFIYGSHLGETKSLKDHRGNRIILLVLFVSDSELRLTQLDGAYALLRNMEVEVIAVPHEMEGIEQKLSKLRLSLSVVTEGSEEIFSSYSLFGRSFAEEKSEAQPRHMEMLVDKQGYIRARWLPAEGGAWERVDDLIAQIELLRKEKARAPAPEEHVH